MIFMAIGAGSNQKLLRLDAGLKGSVRADGPNQHRIFLLKGGVDFDAFAGDSRVGPMKATVRVGCMVQTVLIRLEKGNRRGKFAALREILRASNDEKYCCYMFHGRIPRGQRRFVWMVPLCTPTSFQGIADRHQLTHCASKFSAGTKRR